MSELAGETFDRFDYGSVQDNTWLRFAESVAPYLISRYNKDVAAREVAEFADLMTEEWKKRLTNG